MIFELFWIGASKLKYTEIHRYQDRKKKKKVVQWWFQLYDSIAVASLVIGEFTKVRPIQWNTYFGKRIHRTYFIYCFCEFIDLSSFCVPSFCNFIYSRSEVVRGNECHGFWTVLEEPDVHFKPVEAKVYASWGLSFFLCYIDFLMRCSSPSATLICLATITRFPPKLYHEPGFRTTIIRTRAVWVYIIFMRL